MKELTGYSSIDKPWLKSYDFDVDKLITKRMDMKYAKRAIEMHRDGEAIKVLLENQQIIFFSGFIQLLVIKGRKMQISNNFNTNFGALFGKKEITTKYGKNNDVEITTIQHVYPFKDGNITKLLQIPTMDLSSLTEGNYSVEYTVTDSDIKHNIQYNIGKQKGVLLNENNR